MSAGQRATIPQEFQDLTSAVLLLPAEPEYAHANLLLNAAKVETDFGKTLGLPIPGRQLESSAPGYAAFDEMTLKLVGPPDPVYGDAIVVATEWMDSTKGLGHTMRMNRPKFDDSTYTKASRRVPTGMAIDKTPITFGSDQVTLTIERLAGPYDNNAAKVRPYGFERFDFKHAIHNPKAIMDLHIVRDFRKTMDKIGVQLFDQGTAIYPTGMTADNDSLTAGDFPMSYEFLTRVVLSLVRGNTPRFKNGRWMVWLTPLQTQQLSVDSQYLKLVRYRDDVNPVFKDNYRGTVGPLDIFESNTLTTSVNSHDVEIQYGQAFGPKSVGMGMTEMPRFAQDSDDNFGETPKGIWIFYNGTDVLASDRQRSLRTS